MLLNMWKISNVAKGCKYSLDVVKFIGSVIVITQAYSGLYLTEAKCSISRLFVVENDNEIVHINPSNFITCEK
jgi:hypothetical protein